MRRKKTKRKVRSIINIMESTLTKKKRVFRIKGRMTPFQVQKYPRLFIKTKMEAAFKALMKLWMKSRNPLI